MHANDIAPSVDTLRRFDRPGPRYTSYPTAVEFHPGVGADGYGERLRMAERRGPAEPLSLYAHLPFCAHRCSFCGCHVVITPYQAVAAKYLDYLEREISLVAERLPRRRRVAQMHWGGGTPTFFAPAQLRRLFAHLERYFELEPGAEIAIEVDPRVTTAEHLDTLAELGFNRLSLGVQDFTPAVQAAIDRNQCFAQTRELVARARRLGFDEGVNLDLIYGLPFQDLDSFATNLDQVIELAPDRLAVYSFAYVPWLKVNQRRIDAGALPDPEVKLELYLTALRRLLAAGYEPIGMDHFALPDDELAVAARAGRLQRNFMGYTVKPTETMIAFGISGIGDLEHAYFQNVKKLSHFYRALDRGELPIERGYLLDADDRLRRYVIAQLMCNFVVDKAEVEERFEVEFDRYFAIPLGTLAPLAEEGLVELGGDAIRVSARGRLFVRNVCMAFDRHLEVKHDQKPVFSRTV